jgi:hypothetical protein
VSVGYDVIGQDETDYGESKDSRIHHIPPHRIAASGFPRDVTPYEGNTFRTGQTFGDY